MPKLKAIGNNLNLRPIISFWQYYFGSSQKANVRNYHQKFKKNQPLFLDEAT